MLVLRSKKSDSNSFIGDVVNELDGGAVSLGA